MSFLFAYIRVSSNQLNCVVAEAYDRKLVEMTKDLELDPPMSLVKSAVLVDANNDTCFPLVSSMMYIYSDGKWIPQRKGKCMLGGLTVKRPVPEVIKASFTVTVTGRRLVCSTSNFLVLIRASKWSECELSRKYHRCVMSGPTTTGNEALVTCAAKCECSGDDCEHVTINIPELQEFWELCEIRIQ